jgi:hypothetical protein
MGDLRQIKKKGQRVGPHALDKNLIGSDEPSATSGNSRPRWKKHRGLVTRRTVRAVVNRQFKQHQVHYCAVTFVWILSSRGVFALAVRRTGSRDFAALTAGKLDC